MESRYDTDFHHFLGSFLNNMDITVLPTALITSQPLVHSFGLQRLQRLGESSPYACIRLLHLMDNKALPALEALGKDVRKNEELKVMEQKMYVPMRQHSNRCNSNCFPKKECTESPQIFFFFFFFCKKWQVKYCPDIWWLKREGLCAEYSHWDYTLLSQ